LSRFDATDLAILDALQQDATATSAQLAEVVGMSQSPVWRRMAALDASGVIRTKAAVLDRTKVGLTFMAYVFVRLRDQSSETVNQFMAQASAIPQVVQCHMLLGDIDFLLLVVTRGLDDYQALLRERLSGIPGVAGLDTRVVIEEGKSTTRLPIGAD
jgi:Lrp/AsnC family transcriptional regulator